MLAELNRCLGELRALRELEGGGTIAARNAGGDWRWKSEDWRAVGACEIVVERASRALGAASSNALLDFLLSGIAIERGIDPQAWFLWPQDMQFKPDDLFAALEPWIVQEIEA